MITLSRTNQSEHFFVQAHAIRSTELKPKTPRYGATKTCTDKNTPNQNINTHLNILVTFSCFQSLAKHYELIPRHPTPTQALSRDTFLAPPAPTRTHPTRELLSTLIFCSNIIQKGSKTKMALVLP